jgi:hypothetical protein
MKLYKDLLRATERYHYDEPTCGVLVDVFHSGTHWHAVAVAENPEWYCHNGFGETKEEAIKEAIAGVLSLVKDID